MYTSLFIFHESNNRNCIITPRLLYKYSKLNKIYIQINIKLKIVYIANHLLN